MLTRSFQEIRDSNVARIKDRGAVVFVLLVPSDQTFQARRRSHDLRTLLSLTERLANFAGGRELETVEATCLKPTARPVEHPRSFEPPARRHCLARRRRTFPSGRGIPIGTRSEKTTICQDLRSKYPRSSVRIAPGVDCNGQEEEKDAGYCRENHQAC
jgi:hypothetical protein